MDKWAKRAVEGHFTGKFPWYPIEDFMIEESARIVGGKPIEVTIMNTLTVNVHLSMVSSHTGRKEIGRGRRRERERERETEREREGGG